MATESLDIQAPIGGLDRRLAFQQQPPYTYADGTNFWPNDQFTGRLRGGSRPGLVKAIPTGITGPIHLLANVRVVETTGETTYSQDFHSPLGAMWSLMNGKTEMPSVDTGKSWAFAYGDETDHEAGVVLSSLDIGIGASSSSTVSISILPDYNVDGSVFGTASGTYSVYGRMAVAHPDPLVDCVEARADWTTQGTPLLRLDYVESGIHNSYSALFSGSYNWPVELRLKIDRGAAATDATYTAEMYGTGGGAAAIVKTTSAATAANQRFGFAIGGPTLSVRRIRPIDWFKVTYTGSPPSPNRNIVCALGGTNTSPTMSGNSYFVFEDAPGTLIEPAAHTIVNTSARQLQAAELLGKLYFIGESIAVSVFDPTGSGTLAALAAADGGTVPSNCTSITAWRNRLGCVVRTDPQNITFSKVGLPTHWTEAAIPVGAACKLNTSGVDCGKVGEPINCLVSHSDDYLLLGCLNSLYVLRGDPTYGGQIDRLSSSIGITAPQAFARGPNGETIFLGNDGLYGIGAGVLEYPQSLSREKLPRELRDIDVANMRVLLAFDGRNRGVFIGLTPMLAGGGTYFWFDWETRGFHPMEFDASHEPTALVFRNADSPLDQRLLFGCRDGYIRCFNDNAFTDDGLNRRTELLIGPIALGGGGYRDGLLVEIVGQLSRESSNVQCGVKVGDSIEAAYHATERDIFTLRPGKNLTSRPRLRGSACFIRLSTTGADAWAMENMTLVREKLGKQRLL